jgi:hypothetical protein
MQSTRQRTRSYLAPVLGILLLMGLLAGAGKAVALPKTAGSDQSGEDALPDELITTIINPSKDNTLYEDSKGSLSNGKGEHIFAGETLSYGARRAMMAFDIAGNIPFGATVISATLDLHLSLFTVFSQTVSLHALQADWGEGHSVAPGAEGGGGPATTGDATWLHTFYDTDVWKNEGGDFVETASVTQTVGTASYYTWGPSSGMIADIKGWLYDPDSNFGWIIIGNEDEIQTAKRFDSRENGTEAYRPKLTVTYLPPKYVYLPLVIK